MSFSRHSTGASSTSVGTRGADRRHKGVFGYELGTGTSALQACGGQDEGRGADFCGWRFGAAATEQFKVAEGKRKLDYAFTGPHTVKRIINDVAVELDLQGDDQTHPGFHVSLLEPFVPRDKAAVQSGTSELAVEPDSLDRVLMMRRRGRGGIQYLVHWSGRDTTT
jgi:hypothetical protein